MSPELNVERGQLTRFCTGCGKPLTETADKKTPMYETGALKSIDTKCGLCLKNSEVGDKR